MDYGYNDNVSYQPHSRDAIGSSFQSAAPVLSMIGERGQDKYLLMYSGDYRNYSSDSADNYNDHFFRFNGAWRYGLKHGLTLNLEDTLGHESRGRGITEGFLPGQFEQYGIKSPLTTNFINSELRYSYGAPDGRGKAELALLYKKLTFGNTSDAQRVVKISTITFRNRNGTKIAWWQKFLTNTHPERVFAIALLLTSVTMITTQKKTLMSIICCMA